MPFNHLATLEHIGQTAVRRGRVNEVLADGTLMVQCEGESDSQIPCDFLVTCSAAPPEVTSGCLVLFVAPETGVGRGCVLGAIGRYETSENTESESLTIHKDNIEIVADSSLVLRCGEGTLTVSEDGTVIIRGTRLLSRSKGINKIKGAAVQIN